MVFIEGMKVGETTGNHKREGSSKLAKRMGGEGRMNGAGDGADRGEAPARLYPLRFQQS